MRNDDTTVDSTEVQIEDKGNQEFIDVLTTGEGPLVSGCQPGMVTATEAGQKNLCEALAAAGDKAQVKKKLKRKKHPKPNRKPLKSFILICFQHQSKNKIDRV